jgi:hypothetical protein
MGFTKDRFVVDCLREFEAIFKKVLTRLSGAYEELFDEKNQRSKISCQGPFKPINLLQNLWTKKDFSADKRMSFPKNWIAE